MQNYALSDDDRKNLARHHSLFHAALAATANAHFGRMPAKLNALDNNEHGGIEVDGCAIVILPAHVAGVHNYSVLPTPQEIATAEAIHRLNSEFKAGGKDALAHHISAIVHNWSFDEGNPLRTDAPLKGMFGTLINDKTPA